MTEWHPDPDQLFALALADLDARGTHSDVARRLSET